MYDPRAIANFILDTADHRRLPITNMALHKIMFFAHGWSFAERDRPLVTASFEAWQHGPVMPIIYRQFSKFGRQPVRARATRVEISTGRDVPVNGTLAPEDARFVERVTEMLGPVSGLLLSDMSHERGGPWDIVWNAKQRVNPGMVIPNELIATHFKQQANARKNSHAH